MEEIRADATVGDKPNLPSRGSVASIAPIEAGSEREESLLGLLRVIARTELRRSASDAVREILERKKEQPQY